ncbi:TPA: DUF551 domain-containing protein [Klebsiella pneumoniae]|nr:hypothetical protein DMQ18_07225 [Klebsiella pneumoniae]HBY8127181.1 DUF551 domain-containing protein [Klebsiella pneumoniae]
MTKSTITRERAQQIFLGNGPEPSASEERELARMALAAMDSEPDCNERKLFCSTDTTRMRKTISVSAGTEDAPLYRHAQPAPVVQCPFPCGWDNLNKLAIQDAELVARGLVEGELTTEAHRQAAISNNDRLLKVISSCRAAMLAAAPQLPGSEPATVPGKWIPVSERMPIEFEAVIAFDGDQVYGEAMYSSDDGFTIDGYEPCDRLNLQNVTYWMPLPAAPQEVKGE